MYSLFFYNQLLRDWLYYLPKFKQREVVSLAKGKYQKWLEAENLVLLEGWARDGLTDEQIANNMSITAKTLYDWKNKHTAIRDALKKGKEFADYQVENALYNSALDGNTTAQIFWLKNRRPGKWRDKPAVDNATDKVIEKLDEVLGGIKSEF